MSARCRVSSSDSPWRSQRQLHGDTDGVAHTANAVASIEGGRIGASGSMNLTSYDLKRRAHTGEETSNNFDFRRDLNHRLLGSGHGDTNQTPSAPLDERI